MKPFAVKRLAPARSLSRLPWGVFERIPSRDSPGFEERLVSAWASRDDAREAARQLNKEEP